jgi:hypothetical protein
MIRCESSSEWVSRQVADLPPRWENRLRGRWATTSADHGGGFVESIEAERSANIELRELVQRLGVVRLPLDASDSHICMAADEVSNRCSQLATVYHTLPELRAAMGRVCAGYTVKPPKNRPGKADHVKDGPAVARMVCPLWWRRQLRKVHARQVEGSAISLGYVNKVADPYVSNESVNRRAQQNERNVAMLEATTATNEDGQEYTLAELAAKGPANKAIRRAELMTRIAGFERIALDMKHAALFCTLTAPSRMHKWIVGHDKKTVFPNKRYDGTLPNEAQQHHAKVWARTRASLKRQGVEVYGFRIAEPNHDGTPHWHMLFFMAPGHVAAFKATLWHYALQDSGTERGAAEHRCDFKPIEAGRGTAAGYIAKYVAKNIDGYALRTDLCGGEYIEANSITTAHRVEAWASTWGIRQFQQIGGPPVGPWRELRRVESVPDNAPQHLIDAHDAVNKIEPEDDGAAKPVAWDKYVKAQGGVFCGREYAIRVTLLPPPEGDTSGRYGEPAAPKPIGVEVDRTCVHFTPDHMQHMHPKPLIERWLEWFIPSMRKVWTITRGAVASVSIRPKGARTCVNNCTPPGEKFGPDRPETQGGGASPPQFAPVG